MRMQTNTVFPACASLDTNFFPFQRKPTYFKRKLQSLCKKGTQKQTENYISLQKREKKLLAVSWKSRRLHFQFNSDMKKQLVWWCGNGCLVTKLDFFLVLFIFFPPRRIPNQQAALIYFLCCYYSYYCTKIQNHKPSVV